MDVSVLLGMAAEGMPDRVAVTSGSVDLTYAELLDRAERTAAWLRAGGYRTAALVDVNSETLPTLLFGAAMVAVPFVPLNYRLAEDRLEAIANRLDRAVVIIPDDAPERLAGASPDRITRSEFDRQISGTARTGDRLASPDDVAATLFTSGTSGDPKAAILRHRHLVSYIIQTVEFMGADPAEAAIVSVPPYHIAGVSAVLSSTFGGRRIVYLPAFEPSAWVRTVRDQNVTHAMLVPTMLKRILETLEQDDRGIPSVRHLSYGGGRMPLPIIEQALRTLGTEVSFVNAYGLTETSSTISVLGPDDHRGAFGASDPTVARRLGSVGRVVPGVELEIRNPEGHRLGDDGRGEVWVRGDQVSGEYREGATDADGAWFNTRDVGWLDSDGYLFLEGRADDVIVRGGENLSPGEIEDVLVEHPAVAEAAVVGVPDLEWGQVPAAVLVIDPGTDPPSADDIRRWVRSRLRSSRVPGHVAFVGELPYTDTGKLIRRLVRDQLTERTPAI